MAEDDGFGDAGGGGYFLGGSASESLAGEGVQGRFEELQAAVAGREAEGWGTKVAHRPHCKSVLTYSQEGGNSRLRVSPLSGTGGFVVEGVCLGWRAKNHPVGGGGGCWLPAGRG